MPTSNGTPTPARPCFAKPTVNAVSDERGPLLAHYTRFSHQQQNDALEQQCELTSESDLSWTKRTKCYLSEDIDTKRTDLVLIFCFILTGMMDAGAYNAYSVFVSMVTGNTIFVALGISNLPVDTPNYAWTKSITSILAFIVGTLLFSTFHRTFGARKRWPLILTFVIQAILVFISASLIAGRSSSESPAKPPTVANRILPSDPGFPWADLIPIALLSLQASAKILSSRWLESPHLTTCVLTVLYSDLFADPALFSAGLMGNGKRNQRVSGAVVYFVGAALGGALAKSSVGFEGALWISGACNLGIAGAWAMWWREEGKGDEED